MIRDEPIIPSLLDLDFYKLTMGQFVFHRHPEVLVSYGLTNRTTEVKLDQFIDQGNLEGQLEAARRLRFQPDEIDYLRSITVNGQPIFQEDYLRFLAQVVLPPCQVRVVDDQFEIAVTGPWLTAIYWETLILSIVNELYCRGWTKEAGSAQVEVRGIAVLEEKIRSLKRNTDIRFCDFGTRRRYSRNWQDSVVRRLREALTEDQFYGTSNVWLARENNLPPIGTMAHELFMVYGALADDDDQLRTSHNQVMRDWWKEYGPALSIALTDTFGSEFFFRDMTTDQARCWRGLRQDSGNPTTFALSAIKFYRDLRIDPAQKTVVFSDGLDLETMQRLIAFRDELNVSFGWGTNLTNDVGIRPLSLVVKALAANGRPTVKLSDNLAKATGPQTEVGRYKQVFGYSRDFAAPCRY